MKLRRICTDSMLELQSLAPDGSWEPATDQAALGGAIFDRGWELATAQRHLKESGSVLPFQPASFRDFMLYERHAIDAARGLVRRFHPTQSRATGWVEKLTRRPFPLFKPNALFYQQPVYYMSNHLSFVPSGTPVAIPSYSSALDFELEIGFVLKAPHCATRAQRKPSTPSVRSSW